MKICALGAGLFHADRHDLADSRFSQFCEHAWNAPHLSVPALNSCAKVRQCSTLLGPLLDVLNAELTCMTSASSLNMPGPCSRKPMRFWGTTMEWIISRMLRIDMELCDTTALAKSSSVWRSTSHLASSVSLLYPRWMYLRHARQICNACRLHTRIETRNSFLHFAETVLSNAKRQAFQITTLWAC